MDGWMGGWEMYVLERINDEAEAGVYYVSSMGCLWWRLGNESSRRGWTISGNIPLFADVITLKIPT